MGARAGRRQLLHGSVPGKHHARSSSHSPACLPHHHHLPSESWLLVEPLHFFTIHSSIFPFFNFSPYTAIAPRTHQPGQDPRPAQTTSSSPAKARSQGCPQVWGELGSTQSPPQSPPDLLRAQHSPQSAGGGLGEPPAQLDSAHSWAQKDTEQILGVQGGHMRKDKHTEQTQASCKHCSK